MIEIFTNGVVSYAITDLIPEGKKRSSSASRALTAAAVASALASGASLMPMPLAGLPL